MSGANAPRSETLAVAREQAQQIDCRNLSYLLLASASP